MMTFLYFTAEFAAAVEICVLQYKDVYREDIGDQKTDQQSIEDPVDKSIRFGVFDRLIDKSRNDQFEYRTGKRKYLGQRQKNDQKKNDQPVLWIKSFFAGLDPSHTHGSDIGVSSDLAHGKGVQKTGDLEYRYQGHQNDEDQQYEPGHI
jgi:hypothetical protein